MKFSRFKMSILLSLLIGIVTLVWFFLQQGQANVRRPVREGAIDILLQESELRKRISRGDVEAGLKLAGALSSEGGPDRASKIEGVYRSLLPLNDPRIDAALAIHMLNRLHISSKQRKLTQSELKERDDNLKLLKKAAAAGQPDAISAMEFFASQKRIEIH